MIKLLNPNEDASGTTASPGFSVTFTPLDFSGFLKLSPCGFGGNDHRPCAQVLPTCQGSAEHAPRAPVFLTRALGSMYWYPHFTDEKEYIRD